MAEVVFSGVAEDGGLQGTLFQGMKIWLSQRVPQRSRFVTDIRANGGEVVPLEKQATVRIVDDARKEIPPGSHSYKFIEHSVRSGVLKDLEDYRVGPPEGKARSIGSVTQPPKGTRQKYTADEDRILWSWVHENPQKSGGTQGNEIYKQLEEKHPQHPWQSWRDRWVKQLRGKPRPFPLPHNAPPTPPSDVPALAERPKEPQIAPDADGDSFDSFTEADADALLSVGEDILNIHPDNTANAWREWTRACDKGNAHTAQQWQAFWEEYVRPRYLRRKAKQTRKAASAQNSVSKSETPFPSKRLPTRSPTVFSPFATSHPKAKTVSRSPSCYPESPSMQLTGRTLFHEAFDSPSKKAAQMTTAEAVQAAHEFTHVESPSYHPGMPSMQLTGRRLFKEVSKSPSKAPIQFTTSQAVRAAREFVQRRTESYSPRQETLKRKHVTLEEEIPSSSPLQPSFSPKRKRQSAAGLPLEIASTPDGSPLPRGGRRYSPLFVETEEQANEDAAKFNDDIEENGSPLGRQLSDTLSEPGHRIDDTQAVFRDPTQPLDFDVPPPEEGWGNLEDDGEWDKSDPEIPETEQPGFLVPDESEVPGALVREESLEVGLLDSDEAEDLGIPVPDEKEELGVLIPDEDEELGVDEDSGADASESGSESQSESLSTITEGHDQQIIIPETQAILQRQTQNLAPDFTIAEPDGGWDSLIPSSPPHIPGSPSAESEASSITDDQMQVWMDARVAEGITEDQAAWVLRCTSLDTELASEVVKYLAKNGDIPQRRRGVWTEADDEDLRSTDARKIQHLENKHGTEGLKGRWDFLEEMNS